jgi:transposase
MLYAGLDIHKRVIQAAVLDASGKLVCSERFELTRDKLAEFAQRALGRECAVALEATTNTWAVVDVLRPYCAEVVVSNPLRTKAIAETKIKTDRVDALVLAQLLRSDFLPRVWQPDVETQRQRRLTTRRACLSHDSTRVKNRIHAILHQRLIVCPFADLFSKKGRSFLRTLELDADAAAALEAELNLLEHIETDIAALKQQVMCEAYVNPQIRLLMTLPGMDAATAQAVMSTLADITRFRSPDRAASYLGLTPSTKQSAEHTYYGPITRHGNPHARWLLVQAAQHICRHPGPLGAFFRKLAARKNHNIAVVACARKLVTIAWHMLKNNEPYRYASPRQTEHKLQKLRVAATGMRRRTGPLKGKSRSKNYGTGQRTHVIPGLADLMRSEALPLPQPLQGGEQRMLREKCLTTFHKSIQKPHRVPKKRLTAS